MKNKSLLLIILLGLLPLFNLLTPGLPITHDGTDHVARIANFYLGLTDGVWFPRWGANLNWGYGHPVLMFLYPFSSYFASVFHLIGFSFVDSLKIIFALGFVASGLTMYLWVKEQFGEEYALISSVIYMYAPYRFIDLYVRGAIGEHMAFIFPPLIMFFIHRYFSDKRYLSGSLVGVSGAFGLLLLAHNAISLMFCPVFLLYVLFLAVSKQKYKKLVSIFSAFSIGFLLSSFFVIPAFLEGKFTLRDIVTGDEYKTRFITNPLSLLYGPWSYGITGQFTTQIGLVNVLGILLVPLLFIRSKSKEYRTFFMGLLIMLAASLFLTLSYSNFIYDVITTFKKFQFPWRFLSLSVFLCAVITPSTLLFVKKGKMRTFVIVGLMLFAILPTFSYWKAKEYKVIPDSFYENIYHGTTDTGESSPIWSVRFMEREAKTNAEVIEGTGSIQEIKRTSINHEYLITTTSGGRIRENTLYFPGWSVFDNGKKLDIEFQDPANRGLITYQLSPGVHKISIVFTDTKLRMLSNALSLVAFIFLTGIVSSLIYKKYSSRIKK